MITGDDIGRMVSYYVVRTGCGRHTGTLVAIEKRKKAFTAVIQPPIPGKRKRRVPAEDCEIYTENVQTKGNYERN